MRRAATTVLFSILLVSPASLGAAEGDESLGARFRRTVFALEGSKQDLRLPEHLKKKDAKKEGGEFDVASYFTVLKHVSMEPGYQLDYVYHFEEHAGYPVLYARKAGDPPFETESALIRAVRVRARLDEVDVLEAAYRETSLKLDSEKDREALQEARRKRDRKLAAIPERRYGDWYLEHIRTDGSAEGYLELAALSLCAG